MMSLNFAFMLLVAVFGAIGLSRGFRKELVVTVSLLIAQMLSVVLRMFIPQVMSLDAASMDYFMLRAGILLVFALVGYQSVRSSLLQSHLNRSGPQDALIGGVVGAINGYLLIGSLWFFLHEASYPFAAYIAAPIAGTAMGDAALWWINYLPPAVALFQHFAIYIVVVLAVFALIAALL